MARRLRVRISTYHNWENGWGRIGVDDALNLARMTGATLDYIYAGVEKNLPKELFDYVTSPESEEEESEFESGSDKKRS